MLLRATPSQLATALDVLDDLAELRQPRRLAEAVALEPAADQAGWAEDLHERTRTASAGSPAVCIVDTGVHQTHPLLSHSLLVSDCHACDPEWDVNDHHGHGTEMAGLALYGNVGEAIISTEPIHLRHGLEWVKSSSCRSQAHEELWGAITATAANLVQKFKLLIAAEFSR